MKIITYHRMGPLERFNTKRGWWIEGYSRNGTEQPYMGKRECQREAKREGCKALFINGTQL